MLMIIGVPASKLGNGQIRLLPACPRAILSGDLGISNTSWTDLALWSQSAALKKPTPSVKRSGQRHSGLMRPYRRILRRYQCLMFTRSLVILMDLAAPARRSPALRSRWHRRVRPCQWTPLGTCSPPARWARAPRSCPHP